MARADVAHTNPVSIGGRSSARSARVLLELELARFAYTPLLPAIVDAQWFTPANAAYLGAANLAGYLAGALFGQPLSARLSVIGVLRAMMVLATASFFGCGYPLGFLWFFVWRFAAGFAGGAMMVLAAPTVLAHVPVSRRGLAGGFIFMGVGAGIAASGTLIPVLLKVGLQQTWFGLGVLAFALTTVAWRGWPKGHAPQIFQVGHSHPPRLGALRALYIEYALNAVGWFPT